MPWFPFPPPDVRAVPFMKLDRDEALLLHEAFVSAHPDRLHRMRVEVPDRGGPAAEELGADVEGLRRHWEWWTEQDVPAGPRWTEDELVPFWVRQFAGAPEGLGAMSARAVMDADLLGAHLCEVALSTYPEAEWSLGERADVPRYGFRRYTVVRVGMADLVPINHAAALVVRTLTPTPGLRPMDPVALLERNLGPLD